MVSTQIFKIYFIMLSFKSNYKNGENNMPKTCFTLGLIILIFISTGCEVYQNQEIDFYWSNTRWSDDETSVVSARSYSVNQFNGDWFEGSGDYMNYFHIYVFNNITDESYQQLDPNQYQRIISNISGYPESLYFMKSHNYILVNTNLYYQNLESFNSYLIDMNGEKTVIDSTYINNHYDEQENQDNETNPSICYRSSDENNINFWPKLKSIPSRNGKYIAVVKDTYDCEDFVLEVKILNASNLESKSQSLRLKGIGFREKMKIPNDQYININILWDNNNKLIIGSEYWSESKNKNLKQGWQVNPYSLVINWQEDLNNLDFTHGNETSSGFRNSKGQTINITTEENEGPVIQVYEN
jgi:hypothetical protein